MLIWYPRHNQLRTTSAGRKSKRRLLFYTRRLIPLECRRVSTKTERMIRKKTERAPYFFHGAQRRWRDTPSPLYTTVDYVMPRRRGTRHAYWYSFVIVTQTRPCSLNSRWTFCNTTFGFKIKFFFRYHRPLSFNFSHFTRQYLRYANTCEKHGYFIQINFNGNY